MATTPGSAGVIPRLLDPISVQPAIARPRPHANTTRSRRRISIRSSARPSSTRPIAITTSTRAQTWVASQAHEESVTTDQVASNAIALTAVQPIHGGLAVSSNTSSLQSTKTAAAILLASRSKRTHTAWLSRNCGAVSMRNAIPHRSKTRVMRPSRLLRNCSSASSARSTSKARAPPRRPVSRSIFFTKLVDGLASDVGAAGRTDTRAISEY